jgi:hypothetical protein
VTKNYDRQQASIYQDAWHYAAALGEISERESGFTRPRGGVFRELSWLEEMIRGLESQAWAVGVFIDQPPQRVEQLKQWGRESAYQLEMCAYSEGIDAYLGREIEEES